jgi:predicted GH43/DUF377 family glycosyl hydrolase
VHGVGAMRKYALSAMLLDRQNPAEALGHSSVLRLSPSERSERVTYRMLSIRAAHLSRQGCFLLPYGVAVSSVAFATVNLNELLTLMRRGK